jgi:hypothetical protein
MGLLSGRRSKRRRRAEEIKYEYACRENMNSERHVMLITGQVNAVMAVAREWQEAGRILGYRRAGAYQTELLFPPGAFRDVKNPKVVFLEFEKAAWKKIDPRGQK